MAFKTSQVVDTRGVKAAFVERMKNLTSSGEDVQLDGVKKDATAHSVEAGERAAIKPTIKVANDSALDMKLVTSERSVDERDDLGKGDESATAVLTSITDLDKRRKRAEQFKTSLKISEVKKRKLRATRFNQGIKNGTVADGVGKAGVPKVLDSTSADVDSAKRKARAERFGSMSQEDIVKPKFTSDEEAKKKVRMARFSMEAK